MWFNNKKSNEEAANKLYDEGINYLENDHNDRAIDVFTSAIALKPDFENAFFQRAKAYAMESQFDKVIEDCSKAININNRSYGSYAVRGLTYIKLDQSSQAIADFSALISFEAKLLFAYEQRANCFAKLDQHEEAIADFTKALEMEPDDTSNLVERGKEYCFLGLYNEAIADLSSVIIKQPNNEIALSFRGYTYVLSGNNEKALPDLRKACELGDKEACALLKEILNNKTASIQSVNATHLYLSNLELFNMPSIDEDEAQKFTKHLFPQDHFNFDGEIRPKGLVFYSLKYAFPKHCFGHAYLLSTDIDTFVTACSAKGLPDASDVFKKYVVGHVEIEFGANLKGTSFLARPMKL